MLIKFVGHPDGADLPLGGQLGGEMFCPFDTPVDVPAKLAKSLLEQPTNWRLAKPEKVVEADTAGETGKKKLG